MIEKKQILGPKWKIEVTGDKNTKPASGFVEEEKTVNVTKMLDDLFSQACQMRISSYTGVGTTKTIDTGFSPQLVVIMKLVNVGTTTSWPVAEKICIATRVNAGCSFLTGGGGGNGYINNGVTEWSGTRITIGTHASVNTSGTTYVLIMFG